MTNIALSETTPLTLPSDQEASGRTLGDEEIALVAEAIRSGTLTSTKGTFVKTLERRFAELLGVKHAWACASGTAAVHTTTATIRARLSPRTRAIMVTHLFGNPCEMSEIMTLARSRDIAVIEDCAQALGTRYDGRPVGTLGAVASFSLQQGKHVT